MNKAPVKLSLRKLMIATLALGPLAILPAPLWATPPGSSAFTVTNGSGTASVTGTVGTYTVSDKAVLVWGSGNFNIASGDTWNFSLPSGGSVLNKVGYNTNGTIASAIDNATISGTLLSTGRVFVLANGNITVNAGSAINTSGGLVLSTLTESSDFSFTTTGNLAFSGTSNTSGGVITLGSGTSAASVAGNLSVWGNSIVTNNLSVSGDLVINSNGTGAALDLAGTTSNTSVGGNLTVVTNNGAISATNALSVGNLATITTGGNTSAATSVNLGNVNNDFKTLAINSGTSNSTGNVIVNDKNDIVLGTSSIGANYTVTALNNITTSGAVAVGNTIVLGSNLTGAAVGNITFASGSSAGSINATTTSGPITIATAGNLTTGTITATAGNAVSVTAGNVATINGTITTAGNVTISGVSINSTNTGTVAGAANTVSLTSSAGNLALPAITATSIVATATGGNITQNTGALVTTGNSTFNAGAAGNITLGTATNNMAGAVLTLTGNTVSLSEIGNITLGSTNTTGNLTVNTSVSGTAGVGTVTIGSGQGSASQAFTVGNILTITTNNASVSDDTYIAESVFGGLNINTVGSGTGNSVTINAAASNPAGASIGKFGQWNINAGTTGVITISESGPMNLGNITGASGTFRTTGSGSDILINGQFGNTTAFGAVTFNANGGGGNIIEGASGNLNLSSTAAFNLTSSTSLNLSNSSNSFGGTVTVNNSNSSIIVSGSALTVAPSNVTAGSFSASTVGATANLLTISGGNATNATFTSAGKISIGGGVFKNITVNAADTSSTAITQSAAFTVNGTLTVASGNAVVLTSASNNITGTVLLANVAGDTSITSNRSMTISGTSQGNLTAAAGAGSLTSFANTWGLTIGNLTVKNLTASAANGNANAAISGNSGSITQASGTSLHVENTIDLTTYQGNIVVANAGNSAGRVQLSTGGTSGTAGGGSITYAEDATVKLGNVATNATATVTSRTGSIINDVNNSNVLGNGTTYVLSAPNGGVTMNLTNVSGTTDGNITVANITASGAASIFSNNTITLGNSSANSLQVVSSNNITQSGSLFVYGTANFSATNNITLTGLSNNFGPIVLSTATAGKDIAITEMGGLNLRTVTMPASTSGNFTATSLTSDIISTGFGGVKPGGTVGSAGTGTVSLIATNGNINVGDATTDFPTTGGVVFNAKNVSLSVLGSASLVLGSNTTASVATGNLTVTTATGSILNAGNLTVTGGASFLSGTGNITLNQSGNQFGTLKFTGNNVSVNQSGNMVLLTGSTAGVGATPGAAQLASGGSISVSNVGGLITFGGTASLVATGNITLPKLVQSAGTLTVNAAGTKDLSLLSISGDLNGKTPVNLGTGNYLAPQP